MTIYQIELTNGTTIYVKSWRMVVAFVNTLRHHVETVTIAGCGEILYDAQSVALRTPTV